MLFKKSVHDSKDYTLCTVSVDYDAIIRHYDLQYTPITVLHVCLGVVAGSLSQRTTRRPLTFPVQATQGHENITDQGSR